MRLPDKAMVRALIVEANDGIIATAGIVEGFAGAGATRTTVTVAAFSAMVAGGISLGGAKYAETAAERDAEQALLDEERAQLALSPDEERAELATLYELKGLSPGLARQVAAELTARDALAAHADVEHGLSLDVPQPTPLFVAVTSGLAFALGSGVPLLTVLLAPDSWRVAVTFVAVLLSLVVTSFIAARAGGTHVLRTLVRTVVIGTTAMLLTLAAGSLFRL